MKQEKNLEADRIKAEERLENCKGKKSAKRLYINRY